MENFKEFEIENQRIVVGGYNFQEVVVGGIWGLGGDDELVGFGDD